MDYSSSDDGYNYEVDLLSVAKRPVDEIRKVLKSPSKSAAAVVVAVGTLRNRLAKLKAIHRVRTRKALYEEYDLDSAEAALAPSGKSKFDEEITEAAKTESGLMSLYLKNAAAENCAGQLADPVALAQSIGRETHHRYHRQCDSWRDDYRANANDYYDDGDIEAQIDTTDMALEGLFKDVMKDMVQRAETAVRGGQLLFGLCLTVELAVLFASLDFRPDYDDGGFEECGFDSCVNQLVRMLVLRVGEAAVPALSLPSNAWVLRWWLRAFNAPSARDDAKRRGAYWDTAESGDDHEGPFWGVSDGLAQLAQGDGPGQEFDTTSGWKQFRGPFGYGF